MRLASTKNVLSPVRHPLSESELRARIEEWMGDAPVTDGIFAYPIGDFNGAQGNGQVINRLYYAVPKCASDGIVSDFFIFYEENTMEDDGEDMLPVQSQFFLW